MNPITISRFDPRPPLLPGARPRKPRKPLFELLQRYVIVTTTQCWEWTATRNNKQYGVVGLSLPGKDGRLRPVGVLASRLQWMHCFGEIPEGLDVLHRCDNPPCINPDHLFLGTQLDNAQDMVAKGRHNYDGLARFWEQYFRDEVPLNGKLRSERYPGWVH